ncbi:hypothetical protein [Xylella fastidiosa]|uniref:hypothetical protein n=1 Tax=Xylella fastidiosa TaxID=2371 RepID=UPI002415BA27|nr:hypothetical protein [Xylella fastidiosa]MDG4872195.1 hypothetical protein [Xylella fastidiosa subsp. multiplex]
MPHVITVSNAPPLLVRRPHDGPSPFTEWIPPSRQGHDDARGSAPDYERHWRPCIPANHGVSGAAALAERERMRVEAEASRCRQGVLLLRGGP